MITRTYLHPLNAVRYSWKNLLFSFIIAGLALVLFLHKGEPHLELPIPVIAILGMALAIILGFRNASSYDRWWEARKIWGGIVNDSRNFMRQALTLVDPRSVPEEQLEAMKRLVRNQIAWVNALRLQLRGNKDEHAWRTEVGCHLDPEVFERIMGLTNRVTQLGMEQGRILKIMHSAGVMDSYLYVQIDNTLSRLTDLQGMCERIKATPLPRPYDYYTMAFLNLFILFFPFGVTRHFVNMGMDWMVFPVTMVVGWIFFQIYVFGKVMSNPFENWSTDVPLDAISTTIAIDLKETIGDPDVPTPLKPSKGRLM